jgi:hypothetical protein
MKAPILPKIIFCDTNNPDTKTKARIPTIISPQLNNMGVTPSWTPKSLRAFSVQLNCGEQTIARKINVNAAKGASMPLTPDILSQATFFEFMAEHFLS